MRFKLRSNYKYKLLKYFEGPENYGELIVSKRMQGDVVIKDELNRGNENCKI